MEKGKEKEDEVEEEEEEEEEDNNHTGSDGRWTIKPRWNQADESHLRLSLRDIFLFHYVDVVACGHSVKGTHAL